MTEAARRRTRARIRLIKIQWLLVRYETERFRS